MDLLDAAHRSEELTVAVHAVRLVRIKDNRLFERVLGGEHLHLHQIGVAEAHEPFRSLGIERGRVLGQGFRARNRPRHHFALLVGHAGAQGAFEQRR